MNIVFKLKDEDIRIIANCIREDRDKIQDLIPLLLMEMIMFALL